MEEPLSNRELKELFGDVKSDLAEIKTQVKATNGRVNALENWRWFITGGLAIITILVLPIFLAVVLKHV